MEFNEKLFVKKVSDELYLVKEWNEEKQMFYVATYTSDELSIHFNIKKEDLK